MGNPLAKAARQKFAKERVAARAVLDAEGQIGVLDARLGVGAGAVKERLRLHSAFKPSARAVETHSQAVGEPLSEEIGGVRLLQVAGRPFLKLEGRNVPLQSMSQLRRIGQQEGVDVAPFIKAMKTHLASGGTW